MDEYTSVIRTILEKTKLKANANKALRNIIIDYLCAYKKCNRVQRQSLLEYYISLDRKLNAETKILAMLIRFDVLRGKVSSTEAIGELLKQVIAQLGDNPELALVKEICAGNPTLCDQVLNQLKGRPNLVIDTNVLPVSSSQDEGTPTAQDEDEDTPTATTDEEDTPTATTDEEDTPTATTDEEDITPTPSPFGDNTPTPSPFGDITPKATARDGEDTLSPSTDNGDATPRASSFGDLTPTALGEDVDNGPLSRDNESDLSLVSDSEDETSELSSISDDESDEESEEEEQVTQAVPQGRSGIMGLVDKAASALMSDTSIAVGTTLLYAGASMVPIGSVLAYSYSYLQGATSMASQAVAQATPSIAAAVTEAAASGNATAVLAPQTTNAVASMLPTLVGTSTLLPAVAGMVAATHTGTVTQLPVTTTPIFTAASGAATSVLPLVSNNTTTPVAKTLALTAVKGIMSTSADSSVPVEEMPVVAQTVAQMALISVSEASVTTARCLNNTILGATGFTGSIGSTENAWGAPLPTFSGTGSFTAVQIPEATPYLENTNGTSNNSTWSDSSSRSTPTFINALEPTAPVTGQASLPDYTSSTGPLQGPAIGSFTSVTPALKMLEPTPFVDVEQGTTGTVTGTATGTATGPNPSEMDYNTGTACPYYGPNMDAAAMVRQMIGNLSQSGIESLQKLLPDNLRNTTAQDVQGLVSQVKDEVLDQFGKLLDGAIYVVNGGTGQETDTVIQAMNGLYNTASGVVRDLDRLARESQLLEQPLIKLNDAFERIPQTIVGIPKQMLPLVIVLLAGGGMTIRLRKRGVKHVLTTKVKGIETQVTTTSDGALVFAPVRPTAAKYQTAARKIQ